MLGNPAELHPAELEAKPEGLTDLTAENIDAEIAAMFGGVSEEDLALLGVADAASVEARSLTGNLTTDEAAELSAIDAANAAAARDYFARQDAAVAAQAAAADQQRIAASIDEIFSASRESDDADDRELAGV